MKQTECIMGMPISIEVIDENKTQRALEKVFDYFRAIDQQFSPYKITSEVSLINQGMLLEDQYSDLMREVLTLAGQTKYQTNGYFNVFHRGTFDPSGIVKGWAIYHASKMLKDAGYKNFYIDAGGDVQVMGLTKNKTKWRIGIRNPFNPEVIVKRVCLSNEGIATSGTYFRREHIYNPHKNSIQENIVSITVIGPNVQECDRFATAAFAMGRKGIHFIESLSGFEGYMIDNNGIATYTSNFRGYCDL